MLSAAAPEEARTKPKPNVMPGVSKATARSRVSNGKELFLEDVDGRGVFARRYRDILSQLVSDLGGDPSEAQAMLCRRASTLAIICEQAEAEMALGNPIDIGSFTTACNALRRLLADIGLERKMKDIGGTSLRDRLVRMRAKAENKPAEAREAAAA